ncbi:MAG: CheF family chemotaxis protein [Halobacteriales archaeon]|nr:CheF family chemotaxis protein [Halobacteriales archaeon]
MSEGEHKVADTQGKFLQVVESGRQRSDVSWQQGRIILSNKRLILVDNDGKRALPLKKLQSLEGRYDVNQMVAEVANYLSLQFGDDVFLIAPSDHTEFEWTLYQTLLNRTVVIARHPAVEGGVVQDTDWEKAQLKVEEGELNVVLASGGLVAIDLDDIGSIEENRRTVMDDKRDILEVEHSEEGTSVETYLSGQPRHVAIVKSLLEKGAQQSEAGIELDDDEKQVLMALYSGVSPFEIPDFVGMEVDEVESVFDRLIELDILEEVRKRREVTLKARGRNIASEAMNEQ